MYIYVYMKHILFTEKARQLNMHTHAYINICVHMCIHVYIHVYGYVTSMYVN